jgi:hypothetical protein
MKLRAKGYCHMHYTRWRQSGDPGPVEKRPRLNPLTCTVEGCDRQFYGNCQGVGYCAGHYRRVKKTGAPGAADLSPKVRQPCRFEGCTILSVSGGLCGGHDQQLKKGKPLTPLRRMRRSTIRDDQGRKQCATCDRWQPENEYYPNPKQRDNLSSYCRRCDREIRIKGRYGITQDEFEATLLAQGGGCAICGNPPKDGPSLHIDHDHACCPGKRTCGKCLRGLLCEDCNRALGMFADSPERFEAAARYLREGGLPWLRRERELSSASNQGGLF